jgi:chitinase
MDLGRLTHVNYAFLDLNEQCEIVSGDTYGDFEKKNPEVGQSWSGEGANLPGGSIGAFRIMRDGLSDVAKANGYYFPNIKIMLSIGGWTWSKYFSACTVDPTKRAK